MINGFCPCPKQVKKERPVVRREASWLWALYFINPMTMFNGDRVSFVRSYVKK
jgi:hypothetical protein